MKNHTRNLLNQTLRALRSNRIATISAVVLGTMFLTGDAGAQFNPRNDFGITQCLVDGENLFLVNGFHIIGSKGTQDSDDNINSMSTLNQPGVMRSRNPSVAPMPFKMTFTRSNATSTRVNFTVSVGPSRDTFASVSIPMECRMQGFSYWRANTVSTRRYDKNRFSYANEVGNYYIEGAPANSTWGEIVGQKSTIRVTVTSSPLSNPPGFVNAPDLATGDRDVEFGFGTVPAGKKASITGYIDVYRTDPSTLPSAAYASAQNGYHQVGRRDGDGWSVNVKDKPGAYMQYGPYLDTAAWGGVPSGSGALPSGRRTATFRMMLDNVTAADTRILTLDVYDATSGRRLATRDVTRRAFNTGAMRYKDFDLEFDAAPGQRLEFRTYWWGGSYVRQQGVIVR